MESNLPFDYIRRFAKILFEVDLGKNVCQNVTLCAQAIGNDSFLTEANLKYST